MLRSDERDAMLTQRSTWVQIHSDKRISDLRAQEEEDSVTRMLFLWEGITGFTHPDIMCRNVACPHGRSFCSCVHSEHGKRHRKDKVKEWENPAAFVERVKKGSISGEEGVCEIKSREGKGRKRVITLWTCCCVKVAREKWCLFAPELREKTIKSFTSSGTSLSSCQDFPVLPLLSL